MPKYIVKSPLEHDLARFEIGAEIELSEKDAAPLLGHTVELKAAPVANTGPTDPAERLAAVKAAIASLDKDNKDIWSKDGRPKMNAVSEAAGFLVTAAERDQALAEMQSGGSNIGAGG